MTKRSMLRELIAIGTAAALFTAIPTAGEKGDKPRPHPPGATVGENPHRNPKGPGGFVSTPGTGVGGNALLGNAKTLVLYDSTGEFGWLGEMYGMMTANLVSHFGTWTAHPITQYTAGEVNNYSAMVYVGSTYDEPLPTAFLDDVVRTSKPVVWVYDNIWQLTNRVNLTANFQNAYGWMWSQFDTSTVPTVRYKNVALKRYAANGAGIMNYSTVVGAAVLARAERTDGSSFPWAVRSKNLTYIGEIPLAFISEGDRYLAYCDVLFDALAPQTLEQHRAMVRLEDIGPTHDPSQLRAIADFLKSRNIPFSFGVIPRFEDPLGVQTGVPIDLPLKNSRPVVSALQYMQGQGGVMVDHGWTHQYSTVRNPYNAVSGDDFEFYRVTENLDHTLNYVGPVPGDSVQAATDRLNGARSDFKAAKLTPPSIFEVPHYAASAADYKAIGSQFGVRYERALYFRGLLTGNPVDYSHLVGQFFPYVVRDLYGTLVIPENLGSVEPEPFFIFPTRFPADIIADAQRSLVVRDGIASFYFHPFLDVSYIREIVDGLQALGYRFIGPSEALNGAVIGGTPGGAPTVIDGTQKDKDKKYDNDDQDKKDDNDRNDGKDDQDGHGHHD
jgi:uncharacterized protein YdaL